MSNKNAHPKEKSRLHPRNQHLQRYDFEVLLKGCPDLSPFVKTNIHGDESIDFSDPDAVKMLNKALLINYYEIQYWDIPEGYLCPPIPGRADYIHYMADVLCASNFGKIPTGKEVKCLDIGVGANCIYPIIGRKEYEWSFIGSEIDATSLESSHRIVEQNEILNGHVELRHQSDPKDILYGVIRKEEQIDITICNPPFHASAEAAKTGSLRKVNNLNKKKSKDPNLNFGGTSNELWCEGGEKRFIRDLIRESKKFGETCFWYSTLVSKQSNVSTVQGLLKEAKAIEVKTIPMGQGNKTSRIIAWTFLDKTQQKEWKLRYKQKPSAKP